MNVLERKLDDITVLDLEGSFVIGWHGRFSKHVADNIGAGGLRLIVNLGRVEYMDSSGIGELVACYTAMQRAGGDVKLIHLNERLNRLLVITKLSTVFETFDSESAAVASFKVLS